jgi:hypothetical protein
MAFRIHDSVVRGEIDNRVKGIVRGKIWVEGRSEPVVLELTGNAHPDLAGCLLTFTNPKERLPHQHLDGLANLQRGSVGDMTASRKNRVFDIPLEEALEMIRRKEKPPEHMANTLYLEWFSERNGRVVIESSDYELQISAPEWRMTREDEDEQALQAERGMQDFLGKLSQAIEEHQKGRKDPEEPWDEFDYEKFFKESDARTDKYGELLDKFGHSEEAHEKIDREMGWSQDDMTEEEVAEEQRRIEELNAICEQALNEPEPEPDPTREGIDWIRTEDGDLHHPLQHRCFESSLGLRERLQNIGLKDCKDSDLEEFIFEFQTTGAKLAGALGCIARGDYRPEGAFTVAYLKRALDHLHKAQASLETVAPKKLLPTEFLAEARQELFEIREGILRLMDEFRGRS